MEFDLDVIYTKLKLMPAVFISGLQYDPKSGIIADYFNVVEGALSLYTLATLGREREREEKIMKNHEHIALVLWLMY